MKTETSEVLDKINKAVTGLKDVWNLQELTEFEDENKRYLWGSIFSDKGLHVLAGIPDSGKSMFCLNLALAVAMKQEEYAGLPLEWKYGRALYVETEDYPEDVARRVKKQLKSFGTVKWDKQDFCLLTPKQSGKDSKEQIFTKIKSLLEQKPADLIVISSFGDLFMGHDSNSNVQMRETASYFDDIAREFNTLIVLIHHVNKSAYDKNPSQVGIQGGSGLLQKVRLAVNMHNGPGNIKYLSIVKGNQVANSEKENALVLEFDEETFTFVNTGQKIPLDQVVNGDKSKKSDDEIDLSKIFYRHFNLPRKEILKIFADKYGYGRSFVDNWLKKNIDNGSLERRNGEYSIKGHVA